MITTELRPVDIREIEPELRRIWREQAREHGNDPLVCVRTLNLIVYSPAGDRTDIPSLLEPLVAEHPARVIVLQTAPGDSPRAWVSAAHVRCMTGRCIGRELIAVTARPEDHRELRSIVLPLLVHDLPVYLWWRGRAGFGLDLFEDLVGAADRIIIDSDEVDDAVAELPRVARAVPGIEGAVSDLAWARLTPWRQLAAQFFTAPPATSYLRRLSNVVLEYGGALPSRAVLLAAWLANRLGWRPSAMNRSPFSLELRGSEGPVRIDFDQTASEGGILSLRLSAEDAAFTITRVPKTGCFVTISDIGGQTLHRRVPQRDESEAQMINRELNLPGHDVLCEQAMALARALLEG